MLSLKLTTYANGKSVLNNLDLDEVLCEIETCLYQGGIRYESGQLQTPAHVVSLGFEKSFCYFDNAKGCIKAKVRGQWFTWYVSEDMTEYVYDRLLEVL